MTAPARTLLPDERSVLDHLASDAYRFGETQGRWRTVGLAWPALTVAVAAATRPASVDEVALRVDLNGYPSQAPTSMPWDLASAGPLAPDRRPRGDYAAHVFRSDWNGGVALYAPYDRLAIPGHPSWEVDHPADLWNSTRDVAWLLGRVHDLLNDDAYEGCA